MDWEMPLSLSEIIDMDWVREKTDEIYKYEVTTDNVVFKDEAVYLEKLLRDSGFEDVESYAIACDGVTTYDDCTMPEAWTRTGRSTLEVINENYTGERMIADTDKEPINLAIWSPPTPEGGICAELINFADGVSDDLHEFAGKIVLCDDSPVGDRMMKLAESGAVGLVSFVRKVADTDPDAVRWMNGVGHRGWYYIKEDKRIWNFSITARRGLELEARLKAGEKITLRAVVNTKVYDGETYTVTGRIPGKSSAEIAFFAHLYEPFPSDDASGAAFCVAIGKALKELAAAGRIPQLEKSIRIVLSMERYGFTEYYMNRARSGKILTAFNMDAISSMAHKLTGIPLHLRCSSAAAPSFMEILLRDRMLRDGKLPFIETAGNLSDDTFGADTALNIPTCWLHIPTYPGRHHLTSPIFSDVDWDIAKDILGTILSATALAATCKRKVNCKYITSTVVRGVKDDAKAAFKRLRKELADRKTNCFAANIIAKFLIDYHTGRAAELNRFIPRAVDVKAIRKDIKAAGKKYAPEAFETDIYELTPAEARMAYMTIKRNGVCQPMSLARMPKEERHGFAAEPQMLLCALLDGKRTLYEAYVISNFMLERPDKKAEVAGIIEFFRRLAKYGYYTITEDNKITAEDFKAALDALGVKPDTKVVVHSAYASLGGVEGGPETIVNVLADLLKDEGLLMMPGFDFPHYFDRSERKYFDVKESPSCVGIITDIFRKRKDVFRSLNPSHSISVLGEKNIDWVKDHHLTLTMGDKSPLGKLEEADGYALMIGCPGSVTFMHVVETSHRVHCLGYRTEEFQVKDAEGKMHNVRTWGWRNKTCPAYNTNAIYDHMRKYGSITEVMLRHCCLHFFKLSDYRKAYEKTVIFSKKGCISCDALPRVCPHTVESDL